MSLSINTNAAALSAYRDLSAATSQVDSALSGGAVQGGSSVVPGRDTVDFSHANATAAASSSAISDPDLAAQMTLLAAAQIGANSLTALAAQANSSPDAVLALLR